MTRSVGLLIVALVMTGCVSASPLVPGRYCQVEQLTGWTGTGGPEIPLGELWVEANVTLRGSHHFVWLVVGQSLGRIYYSTEGEGRAARVGEDASLYFEVLTFEGDTLPAQLSPAGVLTVGGDRFDLDTAACTRMGR